MRRAAQHATAALAGMVGAMVVALGVYLAMAQLAPHWAEQTGPEFDASGLATAVLVGLIVGLAAGAAIYIALTRRFRAPRR